jgi:hypothetical protein
MVVQLVMVHAVAMAKSKMEEMAVLLVLHQLEQTETLFPQLLDRMLHQVMVLMAVVAVVLVVVAAAVVVLGIKAKVGHLTTMVVVVDMVVQVLAVAAVAVAVPAAEVIAMEFIYSIMVLAVKLLIPI